MASGPPVDKRLQAARLLLQKRGAADAAKGSIPRRKANAPAPLSFAQHRLWFLDRLVPGSPFYNLPAAMRVRTPWNDDAVRRTLDEIVRRHEILRTAIVDVDAQPAQVVSPACSVPFEVRDLRALDPILREREALRLATEDARKPFDLSRPPLMRATILRLAEQELVFLLNMHHIASDGWSMGVLIAEFRQIYLAFLNGRPSPLKPLAIQYADFAAWQRQRVDTGGIDGQLAFWTRQLAGLPLLEMPTDFPHRSAQGFDGETLFKTFPKELAARLHEFSRSNGTTAFITLLAAFNALLHRYTGQEDIVIGAPVANRSRVELEPLIGFFVNSLVLRTDVSADPTFFELLQRCGSTVLAAVANQEVPFEVLVERLQPERTMGRNPLFQVSLQFFTGADPLTHMKVPKDMIHVEKGTASLDLAFDIIDSDEGLLVRVEYSTELFRRESVQRLVAHYENLLQAFLAHPRRRISEATMLSSEQQAHVLSLNAAHSATPFVPVADFVEAQVLRVPEQIALDDGTRTLTYAALNQRANTIAQQLRASGVGRESIVAIGLARSIETVVATLAVWKAGAGYLPLDPALPEERWRFFLSDARPQIILTHSRWLPRFANASVPLLLIDSDFPDCETNVRTPPGEDDLAYVIYTSGSTGEPKGVVISHGAISRHLQWMQQELPLTLRDRVLLKYSFSFDVSVLEIFGALVGGARLHVVESDPVDIPQLARLIRDAGITSIDVVPSMLALLLDQAPFRACTSLRRVICGGEVIAPEQVNRLLATLSDIEFVNMYGPTEATISATYWRTHTPADSVPIGRAIGPCSAYVLDTAMSPLPPGVPGELYLGGACLARGYLNRQELTRRQFVPDPFSDDPRARLYRTGDRCRVRDDGLIDYLGRLDEMVKVRGHRVELGEIEAALSASPLVKVCAATVHRERGQEQLTAYVVPNSGAPELWPSLGEYFVYDDLLYQMMTNDRVRMTAYRSAISRVVRGKVVADLGTGADLALARMCLDAGARRVYAIEMNDNAYTEASKLATQLGIEEQLILLHGDARSVALPEKVDVCVSELIGTIGSSEGAIPILNAARRLLRRGGIMLPERCVTRIAAVSMPPSLMLHPTLTEGPRFYAERVFESLQRRFDIRVCVKNLSPLAVASEPAVFEDLVFDRVIPLAHSVELQMRVTRDCTVDGLLLWIELRPGPEEIIDVLRSQCSWLPLFLPVFSPGVALKRGDTIYATAARVATDDLTPDYLIGGSVMRDGRALHEFHYESCRNEAVVRRNPFYAALHDSFESSEPRASGSAARERQRVKEWEATYERLYSAPDAQDDAFDIIGWNSSYTGEPLSAEEMREQVEGTTERIRALGANRIFEIGCGTGLLLLRLAGSCEHYLGSDFSQSTLDRLARAVARRDLRGVELSLRRADDFVDIAPGSFDVVVLNSVIQYFPSLDYLMRVLEGAARCLRPGGYIFIGDIRNLRSQRMLHAGIELARASAHTTVGELRERLANRAVEEVELLLDPEVFDVMPGRFAGVTSSLVQVKCARHHNELTQFRYDVVLQVNGPPPPQPPLREIEWTGFAAIRRAASESESLLVRGIPNALVARDREFLSLIERAPPSQSVLSLAKGIDARGIEPTALWELGRELGREVRVSWTRRSDDMTYEAVYAITTDALCFAASHVELKPWSTWANVPLNASTQQSLVQSLRDLLQRRLPDYMVPSTFICLDALPLTHSGKLNRRALPAPNQTTQPRTVYVAPETELQRQIVAVWREILGIDSIGIDANFFNVGGHSLLATQVVSRISDIAGIEVPLRLMFEKPTIRQFAQAVEELLTAPRGAGIQRVVAADSDKHSIDPDKLTDEQVNALLTKLLAGEQR